jgi:hypothetical protein
MHDIQMLGLLDHDVLSSIEVPYLPEQYASLLDQSHEDNFEAFVAAKCEADKFDTDIFEFKDHEVRPLSSNRTSGVSIGGATPMPLPSGSQISMASPNTALLALPATSTT